MPDDLVRSAAIWVLGSLLAFELVAAVRSWFDARASRGRGSPAVRMSDEATRPILLSQAFAIREHFAQRRQVMNGLRRQYAALRTSRYGRQLRMAIGRVQPGPFPAVAPVCGSCRASRLKGHAHCLECRRRLVVPAMPAGA